MKAFATPLIVLALSLGALGANLNVRAPEASGTDKCPSAHVVASSTVISDGHSIQRTTFSCPDGGFLSSSPLLTKTNLSSTQVSWKGNALKMRNEDECTCGTDFVCGCQDLPAEAPNPDDCMNLSNAAQIIAQAYGPTFTVDPGTFERIAYETCAFEWTNFDIIPLEYCWDDLGETGAAMSSNCFSPSTGGGSAAACNGTDAMWELR
ncbi:hypothetical protein DFH11DRAFT_1689616 [Phellopilus nigrolimitatus]|nr:hypothetical protein DFH11DRAFT_1689616 [Phellopilus nigrolimitatus]